VKEQVLQGKVWHKPVNKNPHYDIGPWKF